MSNGAAPTFDIRMVITLGEMTTVSCLDRDEVGFAATLPASTTSTMTRERKTYLPSQGGSFAPCCWSRSRREQDQCVPVPPGTETEHAARYGQVIHT